MEKVKHNDWLREQLRDPGFAAEYLTAAAEDEEPAVFLQALRKTESRYHFSSRKSYTACIKNVTKRLKQWAAILQERGYKMSWNRKFTQQSSLVLFLIGLWLPVPASAWVRGQHQPFPDGDATVVLHWFCQKPECDEELKGQVGRDLIRRVIDQWNAAGSNLMFRPRAVRAVDDPCNLPGEVAVILTQDGWLCPGDGPLERGPHAGRTEYKPYPDGARVYIKIDRGATNIFERLVYALLLHEFGHVGGLGHPDVAGQNVQAVMNSQVFPFADLVLYPDDIAGAQALYGIATEPEAAIGFLENPRDGSFHSGVSVISGWVCEAETVEIMIWSPDGGPVVVEPAAYPTSRTDTEYKPDGTPLCGDTDNGFGLLFNWNGLGDGEYVVDVLVDGELLDRATLTVTTLDGEFPTGLSGHYVLDDFPYPGESVIIAWEQSLQNFVIIERR